MGLRTRKRNRLQGYDYSNTGSYFITFCVKERKNYFWDVGASCARPQSIHLSPYGLIVQKEISKISSIYPRRVQIDKFIIMPNHIHLIITLNSIEAACGQRYAPPSIERILQQFKGSITKQIGFSFWSKTYHDHIIRTQEEYNRIWHYIDQNPLTWQSDCFFNADEYIFYDKSEQ